MHLKSHIGISRFDPGKPGRIGIIFYYFRFIAKELIDYKFHTLYLAKACMYDNLTSEE